MKPLIELLAIMPFFVLGMFGFFMLWREARRQEKDEKTRR